jgi:hypothetical protein
MDCAGFYVVRPNVDALRVKITQKRENDAA